MTALRFGRRSGALALLLAVVFATAAAAQLRFPDLIGRVVDNAGLLSTSAKERLTTWLAGLEAAKRYQVVVVTLPDLQGRSIEDYGYQLGRHWGIGESGKNTGALLIVAPNQRDVRIEVGYGLEGTLTDALSRAILERDVLPAFRGGSYEQGILAGTASILRTLGYEPPQADRAPSGGQVWGPRAPYGSRTASSGSGNWIGLLLLAAIFIVITILRNRNPGWGGRRFRRNSIFGTGGFGGFPGGFGGGGSGGGFRGGGGSFGGGGASGKW